MQARHHPRHSDRQSDWQKHDLQDINALSSNRFCQLGQGFLKIANYLWIDGKLCL
jgi:hypothetical protein